MGFPLVPKSVTLNDLEFASFWGLLRNRLEDTPIHSASEMNSKESSS